MTVMATEPIRSIKGMNDVLPSQSAVWRRVEALARSVFDAYGFREIRTNILEPTKLFSRSVGETTDIVEKEMYTFEDRNGDLLSLRPEGTAGVVRSYVEHQLHNDGRLSKLFYIGPMYRHERPQRGRFRQFHQIGAEVLGSSDAGTDVLTISLVDTLLQKLGLREHVTLDLSTLGDTESRIAFRAAVQNHFRPAIASFCADCQRRIDTNPLRIIDCKVDADKTQNAPSGLEFLNEPSKRHFAAVKTGLEAAGVKFVINPRIVRGLDYYCHTVFEYISTELGAQATVAAGGRYDGLVESLGGPPTPGIGFAGGVERIIDLYLLHQKTAEESLPKLFIVAIGDRAKAEAIRRMLDLCRAGLWTEIDYEAKSVKSQMRYADRLKAEYVVVVGDAELDSGRVKLKHMQDGTEREIDLASLELELRK